MFIAASFKTVPDGNHPDVFNGQVVKPTVVHPCHGILLSNRKEQTRDTGNNMDEHEGNDAG